MQGFVLAVAREHWLLLLFPRDGSRGTTASATSPSHKIRTRMDDEFAEGTDEELTVVADPNRSTSLNFLEVDAHCQTGSDGYATTP